MKKDKPHQTIRVDLTKEQIKKLEKDQPVRLTKEQVKSSDGKHVITLTNDQFRKYLSSQTQGKGMVLKRDPSVMKGGFLGFLTSIFGPLIAEEAIKGISKLAGNGVITPGAGVELPGQDGEGVILPGTSSSSVVKSRHKKKKKNQDGGSMFGDAFKSAQSDVFSKIHEFSQKRAADRKKN